MAGPREFPGLPSWRPFLPPAKRPSNESKGSIGVRQGLEARLAAERERIEKHLAAQLAELRENDLMHRSELNQWAENYIEDFRKKLTCKGYLKLQSAILAGCPFSVCSWSSWKGPERRVWRFRLVFGGRDARKLPILAPNAAPSGTPESFALRPRTAPILFVQSLGALLRMWRAGCTEHMARCGFLQQNRMLRAQRVLHLHQALLPICLRCLRPSVDGRPICPSAQTSAANVGNS